MNGEAVRERLRLSLWFVPGLFALAAAGLALLLISIDRRLAAEGLEFFRFGGTAEGARSVLSAVAQSMLTFTGLVFTVTMLVLQLAANQLSPRVMRTYLRDRGNQAVLGLFVATFLFTLVVLREVRSADSAPGFVPGVSIWVAFALLVSSIGAFVFYIDHMAHAIRASTVIAKIGDEARDALDRLYPAGGDSESSPVPLPEGVVIGEVDADRAGTVIGVDHASLMATARAADVTIELVPRVGDFVPRGAALFRLFDASGGSRSTAAPARLSDRLRAAVALANERTMEQDLGFGIRQLVDIGSRALSPGTNDPTTAVAAVDQLHDVLRALAQRPFPGRLHRDPAGRPCLIQARPSWDDFVSLAFDELRLYGAGHLQVTRRLDFALSDMISIAPPMRRPPLRDQLDLLRAAVGTEFLGDRGREAAQQGSPRGQGSPHPRGHS